MSRYIKGFNLLGAPDESGQKLEAIYGLGVMGTTDDPEMKKEVRFLVSADPDLCSEEELAVVKAVFGRSYKKLLAAQQAVVLQPPKKKEDLKEESKPAKRPAKK
jgi:hypothetical protein